MKQRLNLVLGFFDFLSRLAIRHPTRVLLLVALATLAASPGIGRLKLRTDGQALLSPTAPEVQFDQSIRARFGIEDQIVVLIHSPSLDGIFNPGTLQRVRDLTAAFGRMRGNTPGQITSLATEPSFRYHPGTWTALGLLEPPLKSQAEIEQLRGDLRRIQIYDGTLVSAAGDSTVILIGVPPRVDRVALYRSVLDTINSLPAGPEIVRVTGAPVAESLLGLHILQDLGVPQALLGVKGQAKTEEPNSRPPGNFGELCRLLARRVGLVPLAVLVMMLVLFFSFRNVLAMLVPLPGVVATLLLVFGLMGWLGVPVYLTTAVMPVLLAATGVANDIYLFSYYFTSLREQRALPHINLLEETFSRMTAPVVGTSLTAAVGFLSFGFSPLAPVRAFGLCTAAGVLFGLLCSFTVVPALLALAKPAWFIPPAPRRTQAQALPFSIWFGRLADVTIRRRWWVAAVMFSITALTPLGLRHLVVQDSWIDGFAPDSEFRGAARQVNEEFFGMHLLFVSFDAPEVLTGSAPATALSRGTLSLPGDWLASPSLVEGSSITLSVFDPAQAASSNAQPTAIWTSGVFAPGRVGNQFVLRLLTGTMSTNFWQELAKAGQANFKIAAHSHFRPEIIQATADLGAFIRERRRYAVGGVLSPSDFIATTGFMVRPDDPEARRLPRTPDQVKTLWDFYRTARGEHRLRELVDTNYWQSLTRVFLKDANFGDTARLMSDIRAYEQKVLAPQGIKLGFAGDVALSQSLIRGIVTTQVQSLFWSVAGIFVVTALLGGSWRWGLYCVLPSALAVLIKFAIMGWVGINLGVATSMFAAMTLGIGVSCAIQLLESYDHELAKGSDPPGAIARAVALTGPPALINTAAISLGFSVLMLSQVPANSRLGLLVVLGLVECLIASLALLPLLLSRWPLKR